MLLLWSWIEYAKKSWPRLSRIWTRRNGPRMNPSAVAATSTTRLGTTIRPVTIITAIFVVIFVGVVVFGGLHTTTTTLRIAMRMSGLRR
ncbi:hypothetical protein VNO78_12479 [Psophocarpus tetragonolobus]|uniref:Uncharacterized protein n=1 Tax=Psophocarpus tetragonolobus TaxID=3891 RepID=A0AAN9SQU6_PSOTE